MAHLDRPVPAAPPASPGAQAHAEDAAGSGRRKALDASAPVDWAQVRRVYEAGEESVRQILARFGLKPSELRRAREGQGWVNRPPVCVPKPETQQPRVLAAIGTRLVNNFRAQLRRLERRVATQDDSAERDARTLAELGRAWIIMKQDKRDKHADARAGREHGLKKKNNDAELTDDPAALRAAVEQEVVRLRQAIGSGSEGEDRGSES